MRSKARVAEFGEVFTPPELVEAMVDQVSDESFRIDSRFLEPACGSGNFLRVVLERKLQTVATRYGSSPFEKQHYALFALMSIYGVELLPDNAEECRENLVQIVLEFLDAEEWSDVGRAARAVAEANIIQGDALSMTRADGLSIEFAEWGYLGRGRFQRRDFRYSSLAQRASHAGTLFDVPDEVELFQPTRIYPLMTIGQIGAA